MAVKEKDKAPRVPRLSKDMSFVERLVAVAESQIGYKESERNFVIRDNGKRQGWTVYGDWYGMSYEEWCLMFVSWCLNEAGVPTEILPREANNQRLKGLLGSRYIDNEKEYIPQVGDIVFFHHDREDSSSDPNYPNHVGIVRYVHVSETHPERNWMQVIEGNSRARVSLNEYGLYDSTIVGYFNTAAAEARYYLRHPELQKVPNTNTHEHIVGGNTGRYYGKFNSVITR